MSESTGAPKIKLRPKLKPQQSQPQLQRLLTIMRGLPGSGKSTKAQSLGGLVLSTDDFWIRNGKYRCIPQLLGKAHIWNRQRCSDAMQASTPHIIIDNTNIQPSDYRPYIQLAEQHGYTYQFCSPDTPWATDPIICFQKSIHGCPLPTIQAMAVKLARVPSETIVP